MNTVICKNLEVGSMYKIKNHNEYWYNIPIYKNLKDKPTKKSLNSTILKIDQEFLVLDFKKKNKTCYYDIKILTNNIVGFLFIAENTELIVCE